MPHPRKSQPQDRLFTIKVKYNKLRYQAQFLKNLSEKQMIKTLI